MSREGLDLNLNRSTGGINVSHSANHRLVGTILVKPVILVEPVDLDRNFSFGIMSSPQFDLGDNPSILKNDLY